MNTDELIDKLNSLPVEKRALILDSLIRSFHQFDNDAEREWIETAEKRLDQIKTGKTQTVDENKVFEKIFNRYSAVSHQSISFRYSIFNT